MKLRTLILPVSLCVLAVSCLPMAPKQDPGGGYLAGIGVSSSRPEPLNPAEASKFWDGDSVSGSPFIRINRAEQKAYFYKGDALVGVTPISSGNSKYVTPPGVFKVTEKDIDHRSSKYGTIVDDLTGEVLNDDADSTKDIPAEGQSFVGAPMNFFLRFNWGIGMHEGHLPGYAASHGCVRLPRDMAQKFYDYSEIGTPVIVE